MRNIPILLLVLVFVFNNQNKLNSQSSTDSLLLSIKAMPNDTAKVRPLVKIANKVWMSQQDSALALMKEALQIAHEHHYVEGQVIALKSLSHYLHVGGRTELGRKYAFQGIRLVQEHQLENHLGRLYIGLGLSYRRSGQPDSSFYYFTQAEKAFIAQKEPYQLWRVYLGMGKLFTNKKDIQQAEMYIEKAYDIVKDSEIRVDLGYVIYVAGSFYFDNEMFDKYGFYAEQWQIFNSQKKGASNLMKNKNHFDFVTYLPKGDTTILRMQSAVDFALAQGNEFRAGAYFQDLGYLYRKNKNLEKALDAYISAVHYLEKSQVGYLLHSTYKTLYEVSKETGNTPLALATLEKYSSLNDSLQAATMQKNFAELNVKYETEKKEQALQLQTLELQQKTLQRNVLLGSSFILALLAAAIFLGLRSRLRANRKIAKQSHQLQEQKIKQLEQEKKILAFNSVIEGQEKERMRIAADLHDSLGGLLTSVKAHFNTLRPSTTTIQANTRYQKTNHLIDEACVELRRISHNMMPRTLSLLGLEGALEDLAQNLNSQGLNCQLEVFGLEDKLPKTKAVMLYRIIQELVGNVMKHAQANHLLIQVMQQEQDFVLMVEDDGKGFDITKAKTKKGLGLSSVESRVKFLNGDIDWDSIVGEGTTVNIRVPIRSPQHFSSLEHLN